MKMDHAAAATDRPHIYLSGGYNYDFRQQTKLWFETIIYAAI